MGKVWVLDTDTKGTGAQMVSFEKVLRRPETEPGRPFVAPERRPRPEPEPRAPSRFKVVDVLTRRVLTEGGGVRDAIAALQDVRSVVDVAVYTWEAGEWRRLSQHERGLLWELRGRLTAGEGMMPLG